MLSGKVEIFVETALLRQQPFAEAVGNGERGKCDADDLRIALRYRRGLGGGEKRSFDADTHAMVARSIEQALRARERQLERETGFDVGFPARVRGRQRIRSVTNHSFPKRLRANP